MKPNGYSKWFQRSLFPALDRLNGTSIARKLAYLNSSEIISRDEIRARQEANLDQIVPQVRRSSDFYRQFWKDNEGCALGSDYPALDGLPVLSKQDLIPFEEAIRNQTPKGKVFSANTSGSTGVPLTFYRCSEQESWFWALRFRIWRWANYHPGDKYLTINLNPRLAWKKRLQDVLFRCSYMTFNADNQDSERIIDVLKRREIGFLNGFSSSLYVLARYMLQNGISAPDLSGITATGDTLYPPYREAIEHAFGVRVIDYYGAGGEGIHLASQCQESGHRFHLHPEDALVEILGPKGPVPPGQPGRVVVTQLHNRIMPLIRYDLGDVAVLAPESESCSCGRTLPMLERIDGRAPDLIVLDDGTFLVTHFFVVLFKNLQSIHRYQVLQDDVRSITVRLVPRSGCEKTAVESEVTDQVFKATRGLLECEFEWVDDIPLSGAGKRRLVISSIGPQALGFQTSD